MHGSLSDVANRIQQIVDAAEQAAQEIRADAETEADAYLEHRKRDADLVAEARVAALSGSGEMLIAEAERVKGHLDSLSVALDAVIARALELGPVTGSDANGLGSPGQLDRVDPELSSPPPSVEEPAEAIAPVEEAIAPVEAAAPMREAGGSELRQTAVPEEALLRATQMAVAGSGRAEIERTLVAEFSVARPEAVLDEILGPNFI